MKRVLVIDDEPQIRRLLAITLEAKGFQVFTAGSATEGLQAVQTVRPDIVLLDLGLPDRDGQSLLAELRTWSTIPVIVVSVRDLESDIVSLLDSGADDYVSKPFNSEELFARMNAALRRTRPDLREAKYEVAELVVDFGNRRVIKSGEEVKVTPTEYAIVAELARAGGRIVTHAQLLRELWGPLAEEERGSLRVHVSSLRKKIEDNPSCPAHLITEPGIGYRLC
ncbi:MAG: response regulator transcription factor [Spirochaetota bacterium]